MNKKVISHCIKMSISKLDKHPYYVLVNGKLKRSKFCHFSFIVVGNTVISWGWNHIGEAPIEYGYDNTVHSEVHAYDRGRHKLDGPFEILNLRFNKSGNLGLSAPCICCTNFLRVMGCKVVYFSTDSGIAQQKIKC